MCEGSLLSERIHDYVAGLCASFPDITEVWLIGSRANGTALPESDWDLLAIATPLVLESIKSNETLQVPNVDLLIVYDGDQFTRPWASRHGGGSLSGWEWKPLGNEATYRATKPLFRPDGVEEFNVRVFEGKAIRVWP